MKKSDEIKTLRYKYLDKEYDLAFYISSYCNNANMYIGLIMPKEEDVFGDLTVNISPLMPGFGFVDVNGNPGIDRVLEKNGFAKPTGVYKESGFNEYPLYEFDLQKMKPYIHPDSEYLLLEGEEAE